ncbi:hypothetical protein HIM_08405 [Hirsutella minnesotensis 3608]|uniref:Uncharacterized protein n=1 Tax=Hirsutella minnesotensis 3608 TaxID=1043627 RepID=A0A0F7ZMK1_9HYPO|nr:hypothetical protein HIM_08405 [Hirsutella minnesotensis 3608]
MPPPWQMRLNTAPPVFDAETSPFFAPSLDGHESSPASTSEASACDVSPLARQRFPSREALSVFIHALEAQVTRHGPEALESHKVAYDKVFRTFFTPTCTCQHGVEHGEGAPVHSLQERAQHLNQFMPPIPTVFGERGSYDPSSSVPQWRSFLSDQPAESLSFRKPQACLPYSEAAVSRQWDVDSIWIGSRSLGAVRPPNDFSLCFFPSSFRNLSTDQVVQPHGLNLAHTRHVLFGSFNTPSVHFSVFLFFPNTVRGPRSQTSSAKNSLSLERQRDLYDRIVIPAAYETISEPFRQEIPLSYDIAYAKSRSFQEKPSTGLGKANALQVPTRRGETVTCFGRPRLLFQSHDLKNTFGRPSLQQSMDLFHETVLAALDPAHIDIRSCWLDIGARDYVSDFRSGEPTRKEHVTLLWKHQCHQHFHEQLSEIAPEAPPKPSYFRSFLFRDIGGYRSKATPTGPLTQGILMSIGQIFSVMFSDYNMFGSTYFPLLALNEEMIHDLSAITENHKRLSTHQINRSHLMEAWEANKRHLKAISHPQALTSYGIRKEVTFRLDAVLKLWQESYFDPVENPHTGPLLHRVALASEIEKHCPFWIVPTADLNAVIFAQAARYLLVYSLKSEQQLPNDNWIWLSKWKVRLRRSCRRSVLERQGLGLGASINTDGMLWFPAASIDWYGGYLALERLVSLHIPRSPLHARVAQQANIQAVSASKVTVELILLERLNLAQNLFRQSHHREGDEQVDKAAGLATEEIAPAYQQHLLSKLESYWGRLRARTGRDCLPAIEALGRRRKESAAQRGRIVTAEMICEIYAEAWRAYSVHMPTANTGQLPNELPCWMTTRR